jgi:hypothetical protein
MQLGGGLGDLRAAILEEAVQFGGELRFEARILVDGFVEIDDILAGTMAEGRVFEANVPLVVIFFHFVALVLDAQFLLFAVLRFEAIFGLASFGSEL